MLGVKEEKLVREIMELSKRQYQFDYVVLERFPELQEQDNLTWKINAMVVEMGECMQEWRGFKKWSNKREQQEETLEEFIDWFHFLLSIGLEVNYVFEEGSYEPAYYIGNYTGYGKTYDKTTEDILNTLFVEWTKSFYTGLTLKSDGSYTIRKGTYERLMSIFLTIGHFLGYTWEELYMAYLEKNEENHKRQNNNY